MHIKVFTSMQLQCIETLGNITKRKSNSVVQQYFEELVTKFTTVLMLFSKCHHGYNFTKYMSDEEIKQLGKDMDRQLTSTFILFTEEDINNFMAFYRTSFKHSMHILEVCTWDLE